ncbi:MAG: GNAT family N-acetyltransferase [Nocardioidaceae bacterium]
MSGGGQTGDFAREDLLLRPATAANAAAVAEIWFHGWRDGHLGHVRAELVEARTRESFSSRASERVGDTVVAVVSGDVAGFAMVVGAEVEQVYVGAAHRGSGVADRLLSEAERQVGEAGHHQAWLAVAAGNARARRFYTRRGWRDEGPFDYDAIDGDRIIPVPCHRYVKRLLPPS